jgi:hypothetical protein
MTPGQPAHRFTMKKGIVAPIGVTAVVLASLAVGLPAAQATSGGDQRGTDAGFGEWARSGFTAWQPTAKPPADPDSQEGAENPLNLVKIGQGGPGRQQGVYEREVEGGLRTETSDWVRVMPDGEDWVQVAGSAGAKWVQDAAAYDQTVVDKGAWTETVVDEEAHWQRYSWTGGPHQGDDPPAFPSDAWQPNVKGDPHGAGVEGPYFRSHGGAGNGDWFYLERVAAVTHTIEHLAETHVVHHPAVTHQEFRYERQITTSSHTEYRWSVYERTYAPGEGPAVEPSEPNVVDVQAGHLQDTASGLNASTQPNRPGTPSRAVPVSIDAGL